RQRLIEEAEQTRQRALLALHAEHERAVADAVARATAEQQQRLVEALAERRQLSNDAIGERQKLVAELEGTDSERALIKRQLAQTESSRDQLQAQAAELRTRVDPGAITHEQHRAELQELSEQHQLALLLKDRERREALDSAEKELRKTREERHLQK